MSRTKIGTATVTNGSGSTGRYNVEQGDSNQKTDMMNAGDGKPPPFIMQCRPRIEKAF